MIFDELKDDLSEIQKAAFVVHVSEELYKVTIREKRSPAQPVSPTGDKSAAEQARTSEKGDAARAASRLTEQIIVGYPRLDSPSPLFHWQKDGCGLDQIPVLEVRSKHLACYPEYDLYSFDVCWPEIVYPYERKHVREPLKVSFLYQKQPSAEGCRVVLLDGTSAPIHALNRTELRLNDETVSEYLRFFCESVCGGDGPFLLRSREELEGGRKRGEDPAIGRFVREFENWEGHLFEKRDLSILSADQEELEIPPGVGEPVPVPVKASAEEQKHWRFEKVLVQYGSKLFAANFQVHANGWVVMKDDEPIPGTARLSYRTVEIGKERPIIAMAERAPRRVIPRLSDLWTRTQLEELSDNSNNASNYCEVEQYWKQYGVLCLRGLYFSDHLDLTRLLKTLIDRQGKRPEVPHNHMLDIANDGNEEQGANREARPLLPAVNAVLVDDCLLGGALLADGIECGGSFEVTFTDVAGRLGCQRIQCGQAFRLQNVTILNRNQRLSSEEARVHPEWLHAGLDCARCRIGENIDLELVSIAGGVDFSNARLKEGIHFTTPERGFTDADRPNQIGSITLDGMQVAKGFLIEGTDVRGDLSARGATIQQYCVIDSSTIRGSVSFVSATIGGVFQMQHSSRRTRIHQDLELSGLTARSDVDLSGLELRGTLKCYTGTLGRFFLNHYVALPVNKQGRPIDVRLRLILPTEIGGLEASSLKITGRVSLAGIRVERKAATKQGGDLRLENCCVSEDVGFFWRADMFKRYLENTDIPESRLLEYEQDGYNQYKNYRRTVSDWMDEAVIPSLRADIRGNVLFTNLSATGVDLSNLTVAGEINLRGADIKVDVVTGGSRPDIHSAKLFSQVWTRCGQLNMDSIHCRGKGLFSALAIKRNESADPGDWRDGSFSAQNSRFELSLDFYDEDAGDVRLRRLANIDHCLNLTDCKTHHLRLAGRSFDRTAYAEWFFGDVPEDKKKRDEWAQERVRSWVAPAPWIILSGGNSM